MAGGGGRYMFGLGNGRSVFYGASFNVDEYLPFRNHSLMSAHNLLQLVA